VKNEGGAPARAAPNPYRVWSRKIPHFPPTIFQRGLERPPAHTNAAPPALARGSLMRGPWAHNRLRNWLIVDYLGRDVGRGWGHGPVSRGAPPPHSGALFPRR
jgi:hypothetical protein